MECPESIASKISGVRHMDRSAADTISVEPPARSRYWSPVVIFALAAVLILAGLRVYHWYSHPRLLGGTYGSRLAVSADPHTIWSFPLSTPRPGFSTPRPGHGRTMTFRGGPEQVWQVNTAGATVTVNICHVRTLGQVGFGFNNGPPGRFCSSLEPVRNGTTFHYPSPYEYLLAVVSFARLGVARLDSITYDYKAGAHPWNPRGFDTQTLQLTFKVSDQPTYRCCEPE